MTPGELEQILLSRGTSCRVQKDEVKVETCTFCGNNRWNLELNPDRGVFSCWACKAKGTLRGFLQQFYQFVTNLPVNLEKRDFNEYPPDPSEIQLTPVDQITSAAAYLYRRGMSTVEMMRYNLGFCTQDGPLKNRICFPIREYFSQALWGYQGRSYLGEKPKYMLSFNTPVVCGYRNHRSIIHVLVEGLFDGVAVHRAGYNAAVLLGASHDAILDTWAARIPPRNIIIVLLDGDARERAERVFWRLQPLHQRVMRFQLPQHIDPGQLDAVCVTQVVHTVIQSQGGGEA